MLDILLQILSITGWFLLGLLILVIVLILLLLVWPVSYRLKWECSEDKHVARFKAYWLLGILTVRYCYPTPGTVTAKLFGIRVYDSGKESKEMSKKTEKSAKKRKDKSQHGKHMERDDSVDRDHCRETASFQSEVNSDAETTHDTKLRITERIRGIFARMRSKIRDIIAKIKSAVSTVKYYWELLREEETGLLFTHIFSRSGSILRNIRPRRINGSIHIGTGSPDTTGLCMALYGMLSPRLGKNLIVTPDFEDKVLRGQLTVKGRMIGGVILYNALKVAIDKKLHSFSRKFKREV